MFSRAAPSFRRRAQRLAAPGVAAMGLASMGSSPASGSTWAVPFHAPTIQAGIDSAVAGDTVLVAPGTYTGAGNYNISFNGKNIVVRSSGGAAATVLDVQASRGTPRRGFFIGNEEGPAAVLDGFTIVNGYMDLITAGAGAGTAAGTGRSAGLSHDLSGGGIKCQNSQPTLRNLIIRNCGSAYTGGGLDIELLAEPSISNCVIQGCWAGFEGGGVTIETVSNPTLTNCIITGNRAARGGGVGCNAGGTLRDCVIAGNTVADPTGTQGALYGGGIAVLYPGTLLLERTMVADNCAPDGAGEVFADNLAQIDFVCSALDPAKIVIFLMGVVNTPPGNVFGHPRFCYPLACSQAPVVGGDYHLQAGSSGLATTSPCGQLIGGLGLGCPAQTQAQPVTWSGLKSVYR
jgi:hypothetical protein